jgi:hypothetical protein
MYKLKTYVKFHYNCLVKQIKGFESTVFTNKRGNGK